MPTISDNIEATVTALQNNGYEAAVNDEASGLIVHADMDEQDDVQRIVDVVAGGNGPHVQESTAVVEADGIPRSPEFEAYWV